MKQVLLVLIAFVAFQASAQKIKVEEEKSNLGGGKNPALVVTIYEASEDDINSGWKSVMKGYGGKVSTKDGAHLADNVVVKELSNNTCDVYYKVEKINEKEHKLVIAVNLGGAFMNPSDHATQTSFFKKQLLEFATKTSRDAIADELKDSQKALSKLQSTQHDLEKEQDGLKKDIETYKAKIKRAEEDITRNTSDQAKKKTEIEAQQKVVDGIQKKKDAVN
ncbi:MAG TPA: hypothetical protein VGO45_02470 [Bacteroidia bacterium]|jgi:hypothetical protein|nr:hypothetical protein [Bacteroidia bacterium]